MFGNPESRLSVCGRQVKIYDKDRFLLALLMPPERREALFALFAFNFEIARTREVTTESALGLIRLQWWREALDALYEGAAPPSHEILKSLATAVRTYALPREMFETLLAARAFDLENRTPPDMAALETYAAGTSGTLSRLAVMIAGGDPLRDGVAEAGTAYALAGLLRAAPFHAGQGRRYIPAGATAAQVAARARALLGAFPARDRFTKRSGLMTRLYLDHLQRLDYDPADPRFAQAPPLLPLRLLLSV